jgi:hypothetical protein
MVNGSPSSALLFCRLALLLVHVVFLQDATIVLLQAVWEYFKPATLLTEELSRSRGFFAFLMRHGSFSFTPGNVSHKQMCSEKKVG